MIGREQPPRVCVEFVTMGGPKGQALEERQLAQLKAATPGHTGNNPDLLMGVPQLPFALGILPEAGQRSLYDAFQLQVRYHRPRNEVTIRVTIRADALPASRRL